MTSTLRPDICIIGGGPGAPEMASAAAAAGATVVLVDKAEGGGFAGTDAAFLALVAAANRAHAMRHSAPFGIADAEPQVNFGKLHRHLRSVADAAASGHTAARLAALGVYVIDAEARFADRRTIVAGEQQIRARHVVIATGGTASPPAIEGLDTVDALTPRTAFELTRRPGRLAILGGDAEGIALAQAYRRLGVDAVVIERDAALGAADPEAASIVLRRLRAEGVDIREHTGVARVERRGRSGVRLHVAPAHGAEETVDATHLLVIGARRPLTEGLEPGKAGISFTAKGVTVDANLRTGNSRVYAIGEAAGGARSAHAAAYQAELVARTILSRRRAPFNPHAVPVTIHTDPQMARIGLDEAQARAAHRRIRVLRWPYADNDRALAERRTPGFVKLVTDRDERILGVSIVGAEAGEAIGVWALALAAGLKVGDVAAYVPGAASFGEIGKRAAMAYFAEAARKSGARRLFRLPRIFG